MKNVEIFGWQAMLGDNILQPWKPRALAHDQWPPDYRAVYAWRMDMLERLRTDKALLASALAFYKTHPSEFIMHWLDTYDPRRSGSKWMPFVFFLRQADAIQMIHECRQTQESGLFEKCRDAGLTWLSCGYSVWSWLFIDDDAIGWGSRKEQLVDKIGDADSIFEKMRLMIRRMPNMFLPAGFNPRVHATYMKLINPDNGSSITGEAGDNIGRGGRKSVYFVDESAHLERPEKVDSALGDNTNVRIDISSVNGLGNVFHRRREAGLDWEPGKRLEAGYTRVFVMDWSHHPAKTQDWYDRRRAKHEREGMLHIFAQEVERNYSAAVQNTIIPGEWLDAAVDAHKFIRWQDALGVIRTGLSDQQCGVDWLAGLDVADEGLDLNALTLRQGIVWRAADEWGERDPGVTTRRTLAQIMGLKRCRVMYDSIGVGSGVKTEYNRLCDEKIIDRGRFPFVPWNAGAGVVDPYYHIIPDDDESPLNGDMYGNIKAQAWWSIRTRFFKTWKNITAGTLYPIDELISLDGSMPLLHKVKKELAQPTHKQSGAMKTIVDKKPEGTKSPNLADGGVMMFFPIGETRNVLTGSYGA